MQKATWLIGLLFLSILLVTCGGGAEDATDTASTEPSSDEQVATEPTDTPEPAEEPTDTPEPTEEPTAEPTEEPTEEPIETPPEPAEDPFLATLAVLGDFEILLEAFKAAGLTEPAAELGAATLFAPTDSAFAELFERGHVAPEALLSDGETLQNLLRYHLSAEPVRVEELIVQAEGEDGATVQAEVPTLLDAKPTLLLRTGAEFSGRVKADNATVVESDLEVAPDAYIQIVDAVLTPVGLPAEAPPDLDQDIEAWEPYLPGEPLRIGDAQLVPGAEEVRAATVQYAEMLIEAGLQINIARAVRLEEAGETTYAAPLGADSPYREFGSLEAYLNSEDVPRPAILGVLVLEGDLEIQGAFVQGVDFADVFRRDPDLAQREDVLTLESELAMALYTQDRQPVVVVDVYEEPAEDFLESPAVAIFYGTKWCRHWSFLGTVCSRCTFWDDIFNNQEYDTQAACEAGL